MRICGDHFVERVYDFQGQSVVRKTLVHWINRTEEYTRRKCWSE